MNILELCDFSSNYGSNFIPSLTFLESKLKSKGHNVFFVFSTRNPSKEFFQWQIPFAQKFNTQLFDFTHYSIIKKVVNFIASNNIKLVHAHFIASFYLSEIKKKCPKDVVFFEHIHSAPYNNVKSFKAFLKRIRNLFILNHNIPKICVSDAIVPMTKYIYPLTKIVTCRNAIDFSRLSKSSSNHPDDFKILLFGYNYYVKGVDIAIEAVRLLKDEIKVHLNIVMSANFNANKQKIIEKYSEIPDWITLLPPVTDVSKLYKEHQVFLNASRSEGGSYAIIEAYYCGSLCVVSDLPATVESNLPNVIYFKSGDVRSLYNALKEAFNIKGTYSNDLVFAEKNNSLEVWSEKLLEIFEIH